MASGKSKEPAAGAAAPAGAVPIVTPPTGFRIARWSLFAATVAISIGMLALLDQRLSGIPWVYDGKVEQYQGRQIKIQYCLFSPSTEASVESRCNFAFATAAVGLALAFIWSYLQVVLLALCQNPFMHRRCAAIPSSTPRPSWQTWCCA